MHAETCLPARGLEVDEVKEHERLQGLAQVAGAHEPRDRPMGMAAGAQDDGACFGGDSGVHAASLAALRAVLHHAMSSSIAWAACARCGKSSKFLPCCQIPRNSTMPMWTALRTGAIC